jgi:hypothetical protein
VEEHTLSVPLFNIPGGGGGGRDKRESEKFNVPKPNTGLAAAAIEKGYAKRKKEVDAIERKKEVDAIERKKEEGAAQVIVAASKTPPATGLEASSWEECTDQTSGKVYYWHVASGEVTWEKPKDSVSKDSVLLGTSAQDKKSLQVVAQKGATIGTQKPAGEEENGRNQDEQERDRINLCSELNQLCLVAKPRIHGIKLRAAMDARLADWTAGEMQLGFLVKKLRQMVATRYSK